MRATSKASISRDSLYRYALWREMKDGEGTVLFIMLNPSTADAKQDDPTIRRCIGFATYWGYKTLAVGNLFAYRATDPRVLTRSRQDTIGPYNDRWLSDLALNADLVIAAWGANKAAKGRDREVLSRLRWVPRLEALGVTADGSPKHPLYVAGHTTPVPYEA